LLRESNFLKEATMKPKNGTAAVPSQVETRLIDYGMILKRLDVVLSELEPDGLVAMDVRDRFERLLVSERVRVSSLMRTLGISALSRLPSLDAAKAAPGAALPSITKPNGSGARQ
jgi:hypothetical protein